MSHYEVSRDRIRCHGRYFLGDTFDATFDIADLRSETHTYGTRPSTFPGFVNSTIVFAVATGIAQRFSDSDVGFDLTFFLGTMTVVMAIGMAWGFPRTRFRWYLHRDYRPAFAVRVCQANEALISSIDEAIAARRAEEEPG